VFRNLIDSKRKGGSKGTMRRPVFPHRRSTSSDSTRSGSRIWSLFVLATRQDRIDLSSEETLVFQDKADSGRTRNQQISRELRARIRDSGGNRHVLRACGNECQGQSKRACVSGSRFDDSLARDLVHEYSYFETFSRNDATIRGQGPARMRVVFTTCRGRLVGRHRSSLIDCPARRSRMSYRSACHRRQVIVPRRAVEA